MTDAPVSVLTRVVVLTLTDMALCGRDPRSLRGV
jgi:hypothetical protein